MKKEKKGATKDRNPPIGYMQSNRCGDNAVQPVRLHKVQPVRPQVQPVGWVTNFNAQSYSDAQPVQHDVQPVGEQNTLQPLQ